MNGTFKSLIALFSVSIPASVVHAEITTYRATTDDRHSLEGHGYFQSGDTETFIIAATDRKKGQRLTPRVEREFDRKGLIRADKGVYTFSATYKIDSANNTTTFQLLNHFPGTNDALRPMCFITVFRSDDGSKWHIHRGNNTDRPLLAAVSKTDAFTVKLQADGNRYHVWINGTHAASGDFPPAAKSTTMRYGAYHHGKGWRRSMSPTLCSNWIPPPSCRSLIPKPAHFVRMNSDAATLARLAITAIQK